MRQRKIIPGVDPKLLIKDAAKLMPDPARRGFLRGAASLGALAFLTGCDIIDGDTAEGVLRKISEFNDGAQAALFSPNQAGADVSRKRHHPAVPVQRLLRRGRGAGGRPASLQARGRRPGRQQEAVDARRAARAAARCRRSPATSASRAGAPSAPGRARVLSRIPQAHRRRHPRQIRLVQMRRGLHQHHRHADRAASADADDVQVRQQDPAARLRLPDEDPHARPSSASRTRNTWWRWKSPTPTTAAIGKTRATTGSAGFER